MKIKSLGPKRKIRGSFIKERMLKKRKKKGFGRTKRNREIFNGLFVYKKSER